MAAMEAPVLLFDYFGVLAMSYGRLDGAMIDFIENQLHGKYRLTVLSNMNQATPSEMLGEYQRLFEVVATSGGIGYAKPDKRAFVEAARLLGEFPSNCIMIDDSQTNCRGAEDAGMRAIYFVGLDDLQEKLAKYGILTP